MRPVRFCSFWNPTVLAVLGSALLTVASPAHAGLGDMVKKAKDKVTKSADQQAAPAKPCPPTEYDAVTVELTNDRVERIVATIKAAGAAGADRPAQVEKLNQLNDERGKIDEKHGEAVRDLQRKRSDVESCYHDGYKTAEERRGEEYKNRALTDPALLAKYSKLAQENNAAAMKGDSAALARLNQGVLDELKPTKEDTAQVRKSCGPIPPKSGPEQQLDALDVQIRAVNDTIAKIDERVWKAQAKQGGLSQDQWFTVIERLRAYVWYKSSHPSKTPPCGFSKAEIEAIEKHLEVIKAYLG